MTSTIRHSAETYVEEPGDLWTAGLPEALRERAWRLQRIEGTPMWRWAGAKGKKVGEGVRRGTEGSTPSRMLGWLDRHGLQSAVLYPSVASRAYSGFPDPEVLDAVLGAYNEWILKLASAAPDRLIPVALLNVDDPAAAVASMKDLASRGARGFVIPANPGEGHRYDQPRYEIIWKAAAELGTPLSLLAETQRRLPKAKKEGEPATAEAADADEGDGSVLDELLSASEPLPDENAVEQAAEAADAEAERAGRKGGRRKNTTVVNRLATRATAVFPARRSITAITYAGVFERHPNLYIGVVGYGAAWAAYAMVRADEMYEVRPERTGPPTRLTRNEDPERAARHLAELAGVPVAADDRSGTVGMAPEGFGFNFLEGEHFSDHFRKNVFLTFQQDPLGLAIRDFLGVRSLLWGARVNEGRDDSAGDAFESRLDKAFEGVPAAEREQILGANAARVYGI